MSLRKGLLRLVVATAPFVFFSVATQTRAQSQDENANANEVGTGNACCRISAESRKSRYY
jgi:hypothetical protein